MKNFLLLSAIAIVLFTACGGKKEENKHFISIRSLVEKQVANVDTSLYMIMKVVSADSLHNDTFYIKREDFRAEAKEFLDMPDISDKKVARRFKEEPARFDETMGRAIITYVPVDPDKEEYQKQELMVTPNLATGDKVNNILINRVINNRDSFMQKNMLWLVDKSFLITTISRKPGEPEKTLVTRVTWNEDN